MENILDLLKDIFTGHYAILVWFILAIVVLYIPAWFIYLRRRKKRGQDFLTQTPGVATVQIMRSDVTGQLTVHEVDDEKPVLDSKGAKVYLYLAPGEHVLSLLYEWTKVDVAKQVYGLNAVQSVEPVNKHIIVKTGGTYTLRYDHERKDYIILEEQGV